mmetsp:Transcript_26582/g.30709  ORF Transcript_26582/g.30709 Transcript_26582/m.30709 type:complete len:110 (-) Transcript_26582:192-521(-)
MGCGVGTSFFWTKHSDFSKLLTHKSDPTEDGGRHSLEDRASFHTTPPSNNRSLRVAMVMLSLGRQGLVRFFRRHFELAEHFRQLMSEDDRFEVLETKHQFHLIMFRLKG